MVLLLLLREQITWRKYISASECRVFIDMQLREAFKQHVCIPLVRNKYTDPSHRLHFAVPVSRKVYTWGLVAKGLGFLSWDFGETVFSLYLELGQA